MASVLRRMDGHTKSSTLEATHEFSLYPFEPIPNCRPMFVDGYQSLFHEFQQTRPSSDDSTPSLPMDLSVFSIDRLQDGITKLQSVVDSKDTTVGTSSRWAYCFCTICTLEVRSHEGQGQIFIVASIKEFPPPYLFIAVTALGTPNSSLFLRRETKKGVRGGWQLPFFQSSNQCLFPTHEEHLAASPPPTLAFQL